MFGYCKTDNLIYFLTLDAHKHKNANSQRHKRTNSSQIRASRTHKHKQKQSEQLVTSIDIKFYVFETRKLKEIKENYKIHVIFAYYYNENKKLFYYHSLKNNWSKIQAQNCSRFIQNSFLSRDVAIVNNQTRISHSANKGQAKSIYRKRHTAIFTPRCTEKKTRKRTSKTCYFTRQNIDRSK